MHRSVLSILCLILFVINCPGIRADHDAGQSLQGNEIFPHDRLGNFEPDSSSKAVFHFFASLISSAKGDNDQALEHLEQTVRFDPEAGYAWLKIGIIQVQQGKNEQAIESFQKSISTDTGKKQNYYPHLLLGSLLADSGEYEKAIKAVQTAVQLEPSNYMVHFSLAEIMLATKNFEKARAELETTVNLEPNAHGAWFKLGLLDTKQQKFKDGIKHLQKASDLDPENMQAKLVLAFCHEKSGHPKKAIEQYEQVLASNPSELALYEKIAQLYDELQSPEKTTELFLALLEKNPQNTAACTAAAFYLYRNGQYDKALETIKKAAKLSSPDTTLEYLKGIIFLEANRPEEAITAFKNAVTLSAGGYAGLDKVHFNLAVAYDETHSPAKAERHLKRALALNPSNAQAANYLGYLYVESGKNLEQARKLIERAIELDPANGAYKDSLGWLLFKQGKLRDALQTLLEASKLMPADAVITEHIGDVYHAMGNKQKALQYWKQSYIIDSNRTSVEQKIQQGTSGDDS